MPMYDYRCPRGHIHESLNSIDAYMDICRCGMMATRVLLRAPAYRTGNANRLGIVVHRDPITGKHRFPGRSDAACPPGYERVEVNDIAHARRIERAEEKIAREEHQVMVEGERLAFDIARKRGVDNVRAKMGDMSAYGRNFAEYAIEETRKSIESRPSVVNGPTMGFEALAYDKSNREEHRDVETGWRARKE